MASAGDVPTTIPESDVQEIKETVAENGMQGLMTYIKQNVDKWSEIPLNVAVIGESGSGKSSFINSIRDMAADDTGAAKVGVVETTCVPTSYPRPRNENLKFWDLPRVGTPKFLKETYLEEIDFNRYDFFLILYCTRFSENDLWLARSVHDLDKKFYFVHTKVDEDIRRDKKAHQASHSEEKVLQAIRKACDEHFKFGKLQVASVYLVDNYEKTEFDFGALYVRLSSETTAYKREAMILSLSGMTVEMVSLKKETLLARIWKIALMSAGAGAIPIPGIGYVVDTTLILKESKFYRKQLGLEPGYLEEIANEMGMTVDDLKEKVELKIFSISFTVTGIAKLCSELLAAEAIESGSKMFLPIIDSIIAATLSYGGTVASLESVLTLIVDDAIKLYDLLKAHIRTQSKV